MTNKKKRIIRRSLVIFSILLFVGCAAFLIYYLILQPAYSRKVTDKYRRMYYAAANDSNNYEQTTDKKGKKKEKLDISLDKSQKGLKDSNGILLKFSKLLEYNSDIKGWLTIPGTNIDYPVMQAFSGSDFYLTRDFEGHKDKNGSLYVDGHCNVKKPSKSILIHGHNMDSTGMMFHQLLKYKDINFYKEHPVITFDSIYKEAKWKIIAYVRLSGDMKVNQGFTYLKGNFKNKHEFIDFVYQLEMRSLYQCPVKVNENDHLLLLSTCSYEIGDYRTVVVARRIRKGESAKVDTSTAVMRSDVLYPSDWYNKYEGEEPTVISFEDEMSFEKPSWYDGEYTTPSAIGTTFTEKGNIYKVLSRDEVEFVGCENGNVEELIVPSEITNEKRTYKVVSMAKNCLANAYKLKTVRIGDNITEIPARTFTNCSKLEWIVFGKSLKKIGTKAFYKCEKLQIVRFKGTHLKEVGEKAFKGIHRRAVFRIPKQIYNRYMRFIKQSILSDDNKIKFKDYEVKEEETFN